MTPLKPLSKFLTIPFLAFFCSLNICVAENNIQESSEESFQFTYEHAAILGLVEGVTEYLPISSTGHLIIANHYLGLTSESEDSQQNSAMNAYSIIIQGGAILAVLILYSRRITALIKGVMGRDPQGMKLSINLIAAFIPAAVIGLLFNKAIESYLFNINSVALALLIGSFFILYMEKRRKSSAKEHIDIESLTIKQSILIGICQCFALWPGMSRSMTTILGGYYVGLRPSASAEFSFLLGFITLSAASVYKLLQSGSIITEFIEPGPLAVSMIIATLFAMLAIKWLIHYISHYGLKIFAYYRILLAIILLILYSN